MPAFGLDQHVEMIMQEYDFARDGGAIGDIPLRGPKVPNGFRVTSTFIETLTGITSGGLATIALKMNADGDLLADAAIAGFAAAGVDAGIPVGTAATAVKATDNRTIYLQVKVADLTAGKLRVVHYGYHTSK